MTNCFRRPWKFTILTTPASFQLRKTFTKFSWTLSLGRLTFYSTESVFYVFFSLPTSQWRTLSVFHSFCSTVLSKNYIPALFKLFQHIQSSINLRSRKNLNSRNEHYSLERNRRLEIVYRRSIFCIFIWFLLRGLPKAHQAIMESCFLVRRLAN
jgi:hypothetical protein